MSNYFKNIWKVFTQLYVICKFYIIHFFNKTPVRELTEWEVNLKNLLDKYDNKEIDGIDFLVDIRGVVPYNVFLNNKHLDRTYSEVWRTYDLDHRKKHFLIKERLSQRKIQERDEKLNSLL